MRREFGRQYHFLEVIWKCFGCETERRVGGQVGEIDRSDPAHLGLSCVRADEARMLQAAMQELQVGGQISHSVLSVGSGTSWAVAE